MSKMGQELIEAMQEALAHSEGKIELRTSRLNISPVGDTISTCDTNNVEEKEQ